LEYPLINPDKRGRIGYRSSGAFAVTKATDLPGEKIQTYAPAYLVHPSSLKLAAKDTLGKSDPFFEVRRLFPGFSSPTLLYRSEVVKQDLNPTWKPFELSWTMTGGLDTPFTVTVYLLSSYLLFICNYMDIKDSSVTHNLVVTEESFISI
jgi:hypothetical protein